MNKILFLICAILEYSINFAENLDKKNYSVKETLDSTVNFYFYGIHNHKSIVDSVHPIGENIVVLQNLFGWDFNSDRGFYVNNVLIDTKRSNRIRFLFKCIGNSS